MKTALVAIGALISVVQLLNYCVADSKPKSEPIVGVSPNDKNNTIIVIITRGLHSHRRSKFPIIPPRLQLKTTTRTTTPTTEVPTNATTTTLSPNNTSTKRPNATNPTTASNDPAKKQGDIFELSSSDNNPSIAWPVPRRPASRRLWSSVPPSPGPSTARPVPKLLLPRPTRPAMYSLDGFVPKPSMIRITTTEAPPHIKARYSNLVTAKTSKRKWYGRQSLDEDEDNEYRGSKRTQVSRNKSVSRYTAFKRKGIPGKDYPLYNSIPATNFDCAMKPGPGMYADSEAGCQIWHMCPGNAPHRYSFMCPNGTIFNEVRGVCDWWYNVICLTPEPEPMVPILKRRSGRSLSESDGALNYVAWELERI